VLDNGAKWKDLPDRFGSKSTVHRWFKRWVDEGVFETIMRDAGRCVEERDGFKLYECFIDGTFAKARGGGDGVGCTKAGKGVKIMVLVDARGLPVAVETTPANPHESRLVQQLFDFMLTEALPERVIGDKAYDSDALADQLAAEGMELTLRTATTASPKTRPRTAGRSAATSVAGWWSGRSAGSSTTGGCASAGRNRPPCSRACFIWAAPCCCSKRFWDRFYPRRGGLTLKLHWPLTPRWA